MSTLGAGRSTRVGEQAARTEGASRAVGLLDSTLESLLALQVVHAALLRVTEDLVRMRHLLELVGCFPVALVFVCATMPRQVLDLRTATAQPAAHAYLDGTSD